MTHRGPVGDLFSCSRMLAVAVKRHKIRAGHVSEPERDLCRRFYSSVARAHGIDDLFVDAPNLVPLLVGHVF